jgi:hypothetical protein
MILLYLLYTMIYSTNENTKIFFDRKIYNYLYLYLFQIQISIVQKDDKTREEFDTYFRQRIYPDQMIELLERYTTLLSVEDKKVPECVLSWIEKRLRPYHNLFSKSDRITSKLYGFFRMKPYLPLKAINTTIFILQKLSKYLNAKEEPSINDLGYLRSYIVEIVFRMMEYQVHFKSFGGLYKRWIGWYDVETSTIRLEFLNQYESEPNESIEQILGYSFSDL